MLEIRSTYVSLRITWNSKTKLRNLRNVKAVQNETDDQIFFHSKQTSWRNIIYGYLEMEGFMSNLEVSSKRKYRPETQWAQETHKFVVGVSSLDEN